MLSRRAPTLAFLKIFLEEDTSWQTGFMRGVHGVYRRRLSMSPAGHVTPLNSKSGKGSKLVSSGVDGGVGCDTQRDST